MKAPSCPISGSPMDPLFAAKVLGKYETTYYHSPQSGLIITPDPGWLSEAYQSAITETDVGLLTRNINNRNSISWTLSFLGLEQGPYVDLGGGYGMLARLMRDEGFDFYTTDPYCENMFAKGFEPNPGLKAQAVTAFEVFEHIPNPLTFIQDAFSRYQCRTILFSTLSYGENVPGIDWWYWCFETGQHITFYNQRSFNLLAEKVGCHYFGLSNEFHIITDRPISSFQRLVLRNRRVRKFYNKMTHKRRRKRQSLIIPDYHAARARLLARQTGS